MDRSGTGNAPTERGRLRQLDACLHKRVYMTRRRANEARDRVKATEGKRLKSYRCSICKNFHLTKRSKAPTGSSRSVPGTSGR